jgi:hypothetical protein
MGERSGDTTMVNVETLLEAFANMSLKFACFNDEVFSGKNQNFQSCDYSPQIVDYQDFCITRHQVNGILLYI